MPRRPRRRPALPAIMTLLAVPLVALLGGCAPSPTPTSTPSTTATATAATAATGSPPGAATYVSVGDSYAAGYQPGGFPTDQGFAVQVVRRLAGTPRALELVQLACPGATTDSVLTETRCTSPYGPDLLAHPGTTQLAALEQVLGERAGRVRLVTVVLGGNDVLPCLDRDDAADCVRAALPGLTTRLGTLLAAVRRLAPTATVVGLGYPDVVLGQLARGGEREAARARASVPVFRDLLGPALARTYAAAGARFVDVAALTGAYDPLTPTTTTVQGRRVAAPVARVCALTHVCTRDDIHPDAAGYSFYADRVLEALPTTSPRTSTIATTSAGPRP
ncbi:SGNH/GDSL hydrolase family protein [Lapillicoccus jejuensis]|nr:GDSL-type esterase/lipase family protein [Lapillicoccus jejuensis]